MKDLRVGFGAGCGGGGARGLGWRRVGIAAAVVLGCAGVGRAQHWISYDASLGVLPDQQCWTSVQDISPPAPYQLDVTEGQLHLSTLGLASDGTNGGGVYWQRSDVNFDFTENFAIEARVRIVSAPDHSVNTSNGWPRPGYAITAFDRAGRVFWVGLGASEIFLSNTVFGAYGSANTVTLAFNTTDAYHVYRIEQAEGGVGATLVIDGVPRLTLAALGPVQGSGGLVYFGDPTYWANSESYTTLVRYNGLGNGPITGFDGPRPVTACIGAPADFVVDPFGTGPYTYRWQWRHVGDAAWINLAQGLNTDPLNGQLFSAVGVLTQSLRVYVFGGAFWPTEIRREFRAVVTNPCGMRGSDAAELMTCACLECPADFNLDGGIDGADVSAFFGRWEAGQCDADVNADGGVDGNDVSVFFAAWEAGGC